MEDDSEGRIREKKHFQTIETGKFNKNVFMEKQMRKKQWYQR